jgi:hypothetical protein
MALTTNQRPFEAYQLSKEITFDTLPIMTINMTNPDQNLNRQTTPSPIHHPDPKTQTANPYPASQQNTENATNVSLPSLCNCQRTKRRE